jgi:prepilin-type N-terminal cleavage/methylation domain-containing protein
MKRLKKRQSGFTLVEIAIVLVIIGLLLGGVLKGQELITQAKITNITNDINGYISAIYAYQDRYKVLPGSDRGSGRWKLGTKETMKAGSGGYTLTGVYSDTEGKTDSSLLWADLRLAGFIVGPTATLADAVTLPVHAAGGIVGAQQAPLGLAGLAVCAGNLPAKIAQAIDAKLDDGDATSGTVRAFLEATVPTAVTADRPLAAYDLVDGKVYVLCKSI